MHSIDKGSVAIFVVVRNFWRCGVPSIRHMGQVNKDCLYLLKILSQFIHLRHYHTL